MDLKPKNLAKLGEIPLTRFLAQILFDNRCSLTSSDAILGTHNLARHQ